MSMFAPFSFPTVTYGIRRFLSVELHLEMCRPVADSPERILSLMHLLSMLRLRDAEAWRRVRLLQNQVRETSPARRSFPADLYFVAHGLGGRFSIPSLRQKAAKRGSSR